ncbi:MAG: hypothetical protein INH43_25515, partial [Acidobacteriaceae bacterium]|nr:hypothetical protein [Acidobacteriaceae bacterium]
PVHGFAKLSALTAQVYRPNLVAALGSPAAAVPHLLPLARQAAVLRVDRPPSPFPVGELATAVLSHLSSAVAGPVS